MKLSFFQDGFFVVTDAVDPDFCDKALRYVNRWLEHPPENGKIRMEKYRPI
jgi:hypothetical protein